MTVLRRRTNERVLAAYAVLAIEDIRDELQAERQLRRWASGDLDEVFQRVEALEDRLPTEPEGEAEPEFVSEAIDGLDQEDTNRAVLAAAIELQLVVEFTYTNGDGERLVRVVSPYELRDTQDGRRFVLGYEHNREGLRQFEITRIEDLVAESQARAYRQPQG